jgi:hypothetical protein
VFLVITKLVELTGNVVEEDLMCTVESLLLRIDFRESFTLFNTQRVLLKWLVLEIKDLYELVQLLVIFELCNLETSKIM